MPTGQLKCWAPIEIKLGLDRVVQGGIFISCADASWVYEDCCAPLLPGLGHSVEFEGNAFGFVVVQDQIGSGPPHSSEYCVVKETKDFSQAVAGMDALGCFKVGGGDLYLANRGDQTSLVTYGIDE